jgi:electron transport complex protein RnfG
VSRVAWVLTAVLIAPVARADEVFLTEAQAPVALFGQGAVAEGGTLQLGDAELHQLSQAIGRRVEQRDYRYLSVRAPVDGGQPQAMGAIFLLEVVGQTLPISFAVGVRSDGTLQDLQVMVYREPYGKEINQGRFRAQFRGKTTRDPLTVEKDIAAVSGATISSRSAAYAARKGLALAVILRQRGSTGEAAGARAGPAEKGSP